MKTKIFSAFAILMAITLVSCSKSEEQSAPATNFPADGVIRVATSVGAMQSRAGITTENINRFNLKIENPSNSAYSYYALMMGNNTTGWTSYVSDGLTTPLQMLWRNSSDIVKVTAFSISGLFFSDDAFTKGNISVNVSQDQTTENSLFQSDYLYMATKEVNPATDLTLDGKLTIEFKHLLSKLNLTITMGTEFNIIPGTTTNPISELKVNGTYCSTAFAPMTGALTLITAAGINSIQPFAGAYTAGAGTTNAIAKYEAILVPQTAATGVFSVSFKINGKTYEWKSTNEVTLATGTQYDLDLTVGKDFVTMSGFTSKEWTDGNGTGTGVETE